MFKYTFALVLSAILVLVLLNVIEREKALSIPTPKEYSLNIVQIDQGKLSLSDGSVWKVLNAPHELIPFHEVYMKLYPKDNEKGIFSKIFWFNSSDREMNSNVALLQLEKMPKKTFTISKIEQEGMNTFITLDDQSRWLFIGLNLELEGWKEGMPVTLSSEYNRQHYNMILIGDGNWKEIKTIYSNN